MTQNAALLSCSHDLACMLYQGTSLRQQVNHFPGSWASQHSNSHHDVEHVNTELALEHSAKTSHNISTAACTPNSFSVKARLYLDLVVLCPVHHVINDQPLTHAMLGGRVVAAGAHADVTILHAPIVVARHYLVQH